MASLQPVMYTGSIVVPSMFLNPDVQAYFAMHYNLNPIGTIAQ